MTALGRFGLLALLLIPGQALAAEATCEYRHPAHPSWNFFTDCSYETEITDSTTTTRVSVRNGSEFTTVEAEGADGTVRVTVNGLPATRLARDGSRCFRTDADEELICIHPAGTAAPDPEPAPTPAPGPAATSGDVAGFGGGVSGYCLLTQMTGGVETLTEYGACIKRENCLEDSGGGVSCLTDYDWKSGRLTEMARAEGWQTFDGATVGPAENGCVFDEAAGIRFCFSRSAMTAAEHPVLAAEPE